MRGTPFCHEQAAWTGGQEHGSPMVVGEDDALGEWCTWERVMACCRRQEQVGGEDFFSGGFREENQRGAEKEGLQQEKPEEGESFPGTVRKKQGRNRSGLIIPYLVFFTFLLSHFILMVTLMLLVDVWMLALII